MVLRLVLLLIMGWHTAIIPVTIVSLGSACSVAGALRDNGLRHIAYPFDWLVSPFNGLCQAISDDFKHFLQEDSLTIRTFDRFGIVDYYGFEFVHDFPADRPNDSFAVLNGENHVTGGIVVDNWKEFLPTIKEKYARRITRLNTLLTGSDTVYFIRYGDTTKAQAMILKNIIKQKYPTLAFTLIILGKSAEIQANWHTAQIENYYLDEQNSESWKNLFKSLGFITEIRTQTSKGVYES
jgi:hypothetical protein